MNHNGDHGYKIRSPWVSVLDFLPEEEDLVLVIVEYIDGDREGSLEYAFGYWLENPRSKAKNFASWSMEGWCIDTEDLCLPIAWMTIPECIVDEDADATTTEMTLPESIRVPNLFGRG